MNTLTRSFVACAVLSAAAPAVAQPLQPLPAPPPPAAAPPPAAPAPLPPAPAAPPPAYPAPADAPAPPPAAADPGLPVAPADPLNPPPAATPAVPAAVPQPVEVAEEPLEDRIGVGKNGGFLQPGALLQFWGFHRRFEESPDTGLTPIPETTFRVRRAELRVKGEIAPKLVAFNLMGDLAKAIPFTSTEVDVAGDTISILQPGNDRSVLQDFYITFLSEYADVSLGQFKVPVSLEGYGSSSKLLFPERAIVSTTYGDRRDLGIRVEKKIGKHFYYYAGIFNGFSLNRTDDDNEKDGGLRLEVYPVEGLTLGAVGYTTIGERDGTSRDRLEGDLRYDANDFLFQAEYIHGWNDTATTAQVEGHGAYAGLGYTFIERIQPIVRVGFLNPNLDAEDDQTRHYEAGLNYFLRGQEAKLSLAFSVFDRDAEGASTQELILAAQVSF